jgi:hypothetical protein
MTADYRLSEAGRKASLLAGRDGRTEHRVKILRVAQSLGA